MPERETSELTNDSLTDSQRQPVGYQERPKQEGLSGHKGRSALPSERNSGQAEKLIHWSEAGSRDTHLRLQVVNSLKANEWPEAGLEISPLALRPDDKYPQKIPSFPVVSSSPLPHIPRQSRNPRTLNKWVPNMALTSPPALPRDLNLGAPPSFASRASLDVVSPFPAVPWIASPGC